jgi:hypothetical protein
MQLCFQLSVAAVASMFCDNFSIEYLWLFKLCRLPSWISEPNVKQHSYIYIHVWNRSELSSSPSRICGNGVTCDNTCVRICMVATLLHGSSPCEMTLHMHMNNVICKMYMYADANPLRWRSVCRRIWQSAGHSHAHAPEAKLLAVAKARTSWQSQSEAPAPCCVQCGWW